MPNHKTIIINRVGLTPPQRGDVLNCINSPGYSLIKNLLTARCITEQVEAMNIELYADNSDALHIAGQHREKATQLRRMLDELSDLEQKEQHWSLVDLVTSR